MDLTEILDTRVLLLLELSSQFGEVSRVTRIGKDIDSLVEPTLFDGIEDGL